MKKINVYDFDNTIYNGESLLDFYFYCIARHPSLLKYIFIMAYNMVRYKLCAINEEEFERLAYKYASSAVSICSDAKELALSFWETHQNKLYSWYNDKRQDSDVVVSASFSFLLEPAMKIIGIKNYVSSEIDLDCAKVSQICFGKRKIECFYKKFPGAYVEDFYTDSMNDKAFMEIAHNNIYMVKKGKLHLLYTNKRKDIL